MILILLDVGDPIPRRYDPATTHQSWSKLRLAFQASCTPPVC
jgi:hypothetical protein